MPRLALALVLAIAIAITLAIALAIAALSIQAAQASSLHSNAGGYAHSSGYLPRNSYHSGGYPINFYADRSTHPEEDIISK